jgi:nucleoside-diphosphate-sugar epimerase
VTGRIVLFGGAGFIGTALRQQLDTAEFVAPSRATVDLRDRDRLAGILRTGDIVVNAAGYASATDRTRQGLVRLRRDNVEAVATLVDVAEEVGVAQLVHVSSVAAMGRTSDVELREDDLSPPDTPYGRSKRDAEILLAARMDRLPITILRPTSIFGEGRGLAALLCRVASLPVIPMPAGGHALIPFSYVANLAAAVKATLACQATFGRTFIVGDEQSYPLREIVLGLAAALGRDRSVSVPMPAGMLRAGGWVEARISPVLGRTAALDPIRIRTLTTSSIYSTQAFREATGFSPPVDLSAALERIAAWYLSRNDR